MKKLRFKSIVEIRKKNLEAGFYFFSKETLKYNGSIVEPKVYDGRFFIASDEVGQYGKVYKIWEISVEGRVTLAVLGRYKTLEEAEVAVKELFGPMLETRQVLEI